MSIYEYTVPTKDGKESDLSQYKGTVLLIVNTATRCGFTPEYKELEKIPTSRASTASPASRKSTRSPRSLNA